MQDQSFGKFITGVIVAAMILFGILAVILDNAYNLN